MLSFKGCHYHKDIVLLSTRWYLAYPLSYRHIEEMMKERGVDVDHATVNRWVLKFTPSIEMRKSFEAGRELLAKAGAWMRVCRSKRRRRSGSARGWGCNAPVYSPLCFGQREMEVSLPCRR